MCNASADREAGSSASSFPYIFSPVHGWYSTEPFQMFFFLQSVRSVAELAEELACPSIVSNPDMDNQEQRKRKREERKRTSTATTGSDLA